MLGCVAGLALAQMFDAPGEKVVGRVPERGLASMRTSDGPAVGVFIYRGFTDAIEGGQVLDSLSPRSGRKSLRQS